MLVRNGMAPHWGLVLGVTLAMVSFSMAQSCPEHCSCHNEALYCENSNGELDHIPNVPSTITEVLLTNIQFRDPNLLRRNFSSMTQVTKLTMTGCGIRSIGNNTFADMVNLKSLDLSLNNIIDVSGGAFYGLHLDYLYLATNPGIRLTTQSFHGMTTRLLDLKSNSLVNIDPSIFSPLKDSLDTLQLSDNQITRFDRSLELLFSRLTNLRIQNNQLICDCQSKWLKNFFDRHTDIVRDSRQGNKHLPRCVTPDHLAGKFFNMVSVGDFSCDKPTLSASIRFTATRGILSCTSRGSPPPAVIWYRPNGIVSESPPMEGRTINSNQIELNANELNVVGQYLCMATNEGGNISLTVNVDWPFNGQIDGPREPAAPCRPTATEQEVDLTANQNAVTTESTNGMFKAKYFTLIDLIGAIFGTFICTLIVTVVILHFCVYRHRNQSGSYAGSPPMSEYSSGGSDKPNYPTTFHPSLQSRPLPCKPYHRPFDENHYMSTNVDEHDQFLHNMHYPGMPIVPPCEGCRTINPEGCRTMSSSRIS